MFIYAEIEKITKWTRKNQKIINPAHKIYVDSGHKKIFESKRYNYWEYGLGGGGWGGSKLQVQGMDFYPLNECMYCMYVYFIICLSSWKIH